MPTKWDVIVVSLFMFFSVFEFLLFSFLFCSPSLPLFSFFFFFCLFVCWLALRRVCPWCCSLATCRQEVLMRLSGNSPTAGQHDITSTITLDAAVSGTLCLSLLFFFSSYYLAQA